MRVVLGQPLDVVFQGIDAARRDNARLPHRAAERLLVPPCLLDKGARPGERRADRRAQPLREVDPDGVEGCGDTRWQTTPEATTAFIRRAPSMWVARRRCRAVAQTASIRSRGQIVPPPRLLVFSTHKSRVGGAWRLAGCTAAATCSGV